MLTAARPPRPLALPEQVLKSLSDACEPLVGCPRPCYNKTDVRRIDPAQAGTSTWTVFDIIFTSVPLCLSLSPRSFSSFRLVPFTSRPRPPFTNHSLTFPSSARRHSLRHHSPPDAHPSIPLSSIRPRLTFSPLPSPLSCLLHCSSLSASCSFLSANRDLLALLTCSSLYCFPTSQLNPPIPFSLPG